MTSLFPGLSGGAAPVAPVSTSGQVWNPTPGMPVNMPRRGTMRDGRFVPNVNQDTPMADPRTGVVAAPTARGMNGVPLTYNGEALFRNQGPFVGVDASQGIGMYNSRGVLKFQPMSPNRSNTWERFDALRTAGVDTIMAVQAKLAQAGLLQNGSYTAGRYDNGTQAALYIAMQQANQSGMAWNDYADQVAQATGSGGSGSGWEVGRTYTQTSISYTTKERAMGLIEQAIQQELGRAPTKGETARFLRELRSEEKDNPTVTTYTQGENEGDMTTETTGGVDAADYTQLYAEDVKPGKQQGYKEAIYENMLMSMMGDGSL